METVRIFLWEQKSVVAYPVSDRWIERRIKSYTIWDEKAHWTCDLTVQQFRTLLQSGVVITARILSLVLIVILIEKTIQYGIPFSNCALSCITCNVKKKDKDLEVSHCDIESFSWCCWKSGVIIQRRKQYSFHHIRFCWGRYHTFHIVIPLLSDTKNWWSRKNTKNSAAWNFTERIIVIN